MGGLPDAFHSALGGHLSHCPHSTKGQPTKGGGGIPCSPGVMGERAEGREVPTQARVLSPGLDWSTGRPSIRRLETGRPIDDCEHPHLYLPDIVIASQERAISGYCQQNISGISNSVWV